MPVRWNLLGAAALVPVLALLSCARQQESTGSSVSGGPPAAETSARLAHGQALYDRYCKLCHGADFAGYAADNAPSLVTRTFLETASDEFIAQAIRVGRSNTAMSAYGKARGGALDDEDVSALVALIRSKGPPPKRLAPQPPTGDAARGAPLFEKHCKDCHGSANERKTALLLDNPELLASASPEFLRYAIFHGRLPTAMPAFAGKLPPSEIEDILTFLVRGTPRRPAAPPVQQATIPEDLPVIINPNGKAPEFTLREERFVSAEQVKKALEQKRRIVIVDARSPADWIQFRIPGAIPLPYHDPSSYDRIPNDGTWVVAYCACPHHASGEVVNALRKRGYPHTAVLDEGILFWKNQGYPLAGESVSVAPGAATPPTSPPKANAAPKAPRSSASASVAPKAQAGH